MRRLMGILFGLAVLGVLAGAGGLAVLYAHYSRGLPDYQQLAEYQPPVMTRVYAGDGRLVSEFAIEKRIFVPIKAMPKRVINAFLAAEDKNFYQHQGVDPMGIVRAAITNASNYAGGADRRPVGASTITQQVAKNFLLTNEVSLARKIKEMILAYRIEQAIPKDRILELYLNEIYLGAGSYGVAAAALNYFNKSLDELTVGEAAYLAALPKAPNNYHPIRRADAAKARRDWVIGRMMEDGHVTVAEGRQVQATPLETRERGRSDVSRADYFAEEVRRLIVQRYGETALYKGGLVVRTTLDPRLQTIADQALRTGLIAYDRRHGWRGPFTRIDGVAGGPGGGQLGGDWAQRLKGIEIPRGIGTWQLAAVLGTTDAAATIGFADGRRGTIPMSELGWARQPMEKQKLGPPLRSPADAIKAGDVIAVEPVEKDREGKPYAQGTYALRQIPKVGGAIVAIDPHTGRVLALAGGYDYELSEFNRATQAMRQMGSAFKPFVYLSALQTDTFTPISMILDAPFVIDQGPGLPKWKPSNYTHKFYGPTTLRAGVEKSRNLMTVRLAQAIGMDRVVQTSTDFGIVEQMPSLLSMSLGAAETTPLKLTTAYAMLVNGGRRITPTLIDRVQDRTGKTVFRHDTRECPGCGEAANGKLAVPVLPDTRAQVINPVVAYQMVSILQGVVERGTGVRLRELNRPIAGKTGTTNDSNDAWFMGFTPDLAVGVFVGFDQPSTLGQQEQGASVAVPIFKDVMTEALKDAPRIPFRIPPGVRLVRITADVGRTAQPGDRDVILEAFRPGTEPSPGREAVVLDGSQPVAGMPVAPGEGGGGSASGLY